ncbi:ATP phosphoribosyltransferase [Buchananella hordeovulneris]|uniref:ATP phosphoribosyltransferase n=1 Tax=Buchananella hordeovulneris TaxID=52770 RepID=UPI000F5DF0D0|nr:ATP phosphoribosyltransferase [Buchananella hordeovulneris]RRD45396.1 ATP phosphoribosyltransferase [Buchananella hordeovulneris]
MLRIAVPNKGALSEAAISLLKEAGYHTRRQGRELVLTDQSNDVELFFLRPRDIAVYVGQGTVHVGITGRDLLHDTAETAAVEHRALRFGAATFRFAGPVGRYATVGDLAGARIATSYDVLVRRYLEQQGVSATVVHLDGAVESSVQLGVADAVADVVETGATLKAAGLEVFGEPLLHSEAVLITRPSWQDHPAVRRLDRRIQGVLVAREYVLVDYDIPAGQLEQAVAITPGLQSPTVADLHDPRWKAVRSMVRQAEVNTILDRLEEVGARGIIVTDILACRL